MEVIENKWISVEDRLPDPGVHVFVTGVSGRQNVQMQNKRDVWINKRVKPSEYTDGYGFIRLVSHLHLTITHWLPIPKLNGQEIFETLPVE